MGLPNIQSFASAEDFWWNHWNDHLEIVQAVKSKLGLNLPTYAIYPYQEQDHEGILERHAQFHIDMNSALSIQSSDLGNVDLSDAETRTPWVFANYQEHLQARTALGI